MFSSSEDTYVFIIIFRFAKQRAKNTFDFCVPIFRRGNHGQRSEASVMMIEADTKFEPKSLLTRVNFNHQFICFLNITTFYQCNASLHYKYDYSYWCESTLIGYKLALLIKIYYYFDTAYEFPKISTNSQTSYCKRLWYVN